MSRRLLLLLIGGLLLVGCTGLGGEPRIVATIRPTPTLEDTGSEFLSLGASIYANRCTQCHGPNGAGNGSLVMQGDVMNPGNFTDPAFMAGKTPQDYFNIVTNGNIANLMPPWENELSENERWAVSLYTYTLHYNPSQLEQGEALYQAECIDCHGEDGRGDPQAAEDPGNLAAPQLITSLGDAALQETISGGVHTYGETLDTDQLEAVTVYTRWLGLQNVESIGQQATPNAEITTEPTPQQQGTVSITGSVINGTEAGNVPPDLTVTLHRVDTNLEETTTGGSINADGAFSFADVPYFEGHVYFVSTRYDGRDFAGQPFTIDPGQETVNAPVFIYETTSDDGAIIINRLITSITPVGDVLEMRQEVSITNATDRLYISEETTEDGRPISVSLPLPAGSIVAQVSNETRFVYDQETFTLQDTRAVTPGQENIIEFIYLVPYEDGAIIEFPVEHPLSGPVAVVVDSDTITATSEQLQAISAEDVPGLQGNAYGGNLTLAPGELIRYELIGRAPGVGTSQDPNVVTSDNLLVFFGGAVVIILLTIGGVILVLNRSAQTAAAGPNQNVLIDGLVRQIAELDAQHDAGRINHDIYQRRRQQLQARLDELIDGQGDE